MPASHEPSQPGFAASWVVALVVASCTATPAIVVGAACAPMPGESRDTCSEPTHVLTCRDFTWHEDECRGPSGCVTGRCDRRLAEVGDGCSAVDEAACSVDGRSLLRCQGHRMVAKSQCRGERGCYRDTPDSAPTCDVGQPEIGDACATTGARCSADGKSLITCASSSRRYELSRYCPGPKGCFQFSEVALKKQDEKKDCYTGFVACDTSIGDVGEPCGGAPKWGRACQAGDRCPAGTTRTEDNSNDNWSVCSRDRTEALVCKHGTLAAERSCASCKVAWDAEEEHYGVECLAGGSEAQFEKLGGGAVHVARPEPK